MVRLKFQDLLECGPDDQPTRLALLISIGRCFCSRHGPVLLTLITYYPPFRVFALLSDHEANVPSWSPVKFHVNCDLEGWKEGLSISWDESRFGRCRGLAIDSMIYDTTLHSTTFPGFLLREGVSVCFRYASTKLGEIPCVFTWR
jgi:hypothetical protein